MMAANANANANSTVGPARLFVFDPAVFSHKKPERDMKLEDGLYMFSEREHEQKDELMPFALEGCLRREPRLLSRPTAVLVAGTPIESNIFLGRYGLSSQCGTVSEYTYTETYPAARGAAGAIGIRCLDWSQTTQTRVTLTAAPSPSLDTIEYAIAYAWYHQYVKNPADDESGSAALVPREYTDFVRKHGLACATETFNTTKAQYSIEDLLTLLKPESSVTISRKRKFRTVVEPNKLFALPNRALALVCCHRDTQLVTEPKRPKRTKVWQSPKLAFEVKFHAAHWLAVEDTYKIDFAAEPESLDVTRARIRLLFLSNRLASR